MAEGGTRRKDNNPCPSFSTAEKTKEPSGFCVAKSSLCRVGLRQVTDHGRRFKSGLRISRWTGCTGVAADLHDSQSSNMWSKLRGSPLPSAPAGFRWASALLGNENGSLTEFIAGNPRATVNHSLLGLTAAGTLKGRGTLQLFWRLCRRRLMHRLPKAEVSGASSERRPPVRACDVA